MDVIGRVLEMAAILRRNPDLIIKLATASMVMSVSSAKLYAYNATLVSEIRKDENFYEDLRLAYIDCGEDESYFAELFAEVSSEADKLMLK